MHSKTKSMHYAHSMGFDSVYVSRPDSIVHIHFAEYQLRYDWLRRSVLADRSYSALIQNRDSVVRDLMLMLDDDSLMSFSICSRRSETSVGSLSYILIEQISRLKPSLEKWGRGRAPDCYDDCMRPCGFLYSIPHDSTVRTLISSWVKKSQIKYAEMRKQFPVIRLLVAESIYARYDTYNATFVVDSGDVLFENNETYMREVVTKIGDTSAIPVFNCGFGYVPIGALYYELFLMLSGVTCEEVVGISGVSRVNCIGNCWHYLADNVDMLVEVQNAAQLYIDTW